MLYQILQIISLKQCQPSLKSLSQSEKKTFINHNSCSEFDMVYLRTMQELSEVIIVMSNCEWRLLWLHWQDKEKQVKRAADEIPIKKLEWHFNSNWNMLFWQEERIPFPRNFWGQCRLQYSASPKQKEEFSFSIWIKFWFWF